MTTRALSYLGNVSKRNFLITVQSDRMKLRVQSLSLHVRNFRSVKNPPKQVETPTLNAHVETGQIRFNKLLISFSFTVVFSSATLIGAIIWKYERTRNELYVTINKYQRYRTIRSGWRGDMENWWRSLTDGQKLFVPICFANVLVFLAWRVPAFHGTLIRYFCSNPASSAICWPMLLSTFSHQSLFHLAANMYVLHSFSTAAVMALDKEQFVALYLTSGVISSFASYFYKTMFSLPGFSLGASGAIMGILGFVCSQYPDTRLSIVLLPMYTFTASAAIKTLIGIDALGCVMGWRYFDHAAHLGGVLWGMFWQSWGNANIWQNRKPVTALWHAIREPTRSP